nr:outer membrane beta-barrel protein [uncultured Draconibacterium sp.]
MKSIKYIAIAILCLTAFTSNAQDKKIQLEIGGGYGLSSLSGKVENGSITPGMGYQLSFNGKYFFTSNLGVGIGAGYSAYSSKAELTTYSANIPSVDDENESFEYRIAASEINEEQKLSALEIPVFLAYRKSLSEKLGLNGSLGLKISLPLSATYECTQGTIETRGYYPAYNAELYNIPNHGFEKVENINYSGDLSTQMAYSLFANAGITIPVGKMGINIGIYGSYGLNSILKPVANQLMVYPMKYQSVTSLADKVSLVSGGLKIGVCF